MDHATPSISEDFNNASNRIHQIVCRRNFLNEPMIYLEEAVYHEYDSIEWGLGSNQSGKNISEKILSLFIPTSNKKLIDLFAQDVIDTMPKEGGRIEAETIRDWIKRNSEIGEKN